MQSTQVLSSVVFLALAVPSFAQDAQIKSAQISLETKSVAVEVVTLTNLRDSPLIAWQIAFVREGKPSMIHGSDYSWQRSPRFPAQGPVLPQEKRTIEIDLAHYSDAGSPVVRLVVFEDGYIEGAAEAIAGWQEQKRARTDDAAYWVRTLNGIPFDTDAELKKYLENAMGERAGQAVEDLSGIANQLSNMLRTSSERLLERIQPISREAHRIHDVLTRPAKPAALEVKAPVSITSRREATPQYSVLVRNLRDVAIEAVGFELLDSKTGRPTGGEAADYCCGRDPGTLASGRGPIGPGDSRQFPLFAKVRESEMVPFPRLTFVLFDDLTHEGSVSKLAEILANREQRAADIGHALRIHAESAAKPPSQLSAFLSAARVERATALGREANQGRLQYLDELIRIAQRDPEHLRSDGAYAKHLEEYRARLVRHLKR